MAENIIHINISIGLIQNELEKKILDLQSQLEVKTAICEDLSDENTYLRNELERSDCGYKLRKIVRKRYHCEKMENERLKSEIKKRKVEENFMNSKLQHMKRELKKVRAESKEALDKEREQTKKLGTKLKEIKTANEYRLSCPTTCGDSGGITMEGLPCQRYRYLDSYGRCKDH